MSENVIKSIACVGECMVELSMNSKAPQDCRVGFAGDTLNTAVYLKRLVGDRVDVSYVTVVGEDALSDAVVDFFETEHITTTFVARHPTLNSGLYAISTDDKGERSFTYWRDNSAARKLFSGGSNLSLDSLKTFDLIYFSAISLAILPKNVRNQWFEWLIDYRNNGGLVAFDSNYRPKLWEDESSARETIDQAWQNCDIAFPSADDEMAISETSQIDDIRHRFAEFNFAHGALKNGGEGPASLNPSDKFGAFQPADKVVDSTAAGDSFNAGFLANWIETRSNASAAQAGHTLASTVIGHRGAIIPMEAMPG